MRIRPLQWATLWAKNPHLAQIYLGVRDLDLAARELQWMRKELSRGSITRASELRSIGYPLQYILGSQPFGSFEIKCVPGVLIPRWETEEWSFRLARLLRENNISDILACDLCTGTGCISLALATGLTNSSITGVDISDIALQTFKDNEIRGRKIIEGNNNVLEALKFDILHPDLRTLDPPQLIVSNPPYIMEKSFHKDTDRSVRKFEPKLALVGYLEFYKAIVQLAAFLSTPAVVCEVGDQRQIDYSLKLGDSLGYEGVSVNDSAGKPRVFALWNTQKWSFLSRLQNA